MDLGVIGRRQQRGEIDSAIEAVLAGDRITVELIGAVGSGKRSLLDYVASQAGAAGLEVARAAATRQSQTAPGSVATELGLNGDTNGDANGDASPVLLLDNAHLADPTSVGLLQRVLAAPSDQGRLVVVGHEPVTGHRALPLQRLADTAKRRGDLIEMTLEPLTAAEVGELLAESPEAAERVIELTGGLHGDVERLISDWVSDGVLARAGQRFLVAGPLPESWEGGSALVGRLETLERAERKLVDATALAGRALPLDVAAVLLDIPVDDMLELGETLTHQGVITQTREGFEPPDVLSADRLEATLGEVRRSETYRQLADAFGTLGYADREPGLVGGYLSEAGSWEDALPLLSGAALDAVERGALGEAFPLLDAALEAYEQAGAADPDLEGRLRLGRGQYFRLAGWSDLAAEDLQVAVKRLEGPQRVDAMTFLAAVEDDRQDAQTSEGLVAAAEFEAIRLGETAKLGSVLGLRARELTRLGFANEADAASDKGKEILDSEGNPFQRYLRRFNTARIASDRGRARDAEVGFAGLVAEADEVEGAAGLAEKQAWWARALFMVGRPSEALEAVDAAVENADRSGTTVFFSHMVRSEGAYRYGQFEESLAAADSMLGLVLQQLPAWENAARFTRGRALLGLGRVDEAVEEADRAFELCPPGINGWRWRLRIRVLQMQILATRGDEWPQREAEDLADELLQGNWLDMAVELMAVRAGKERDPDLARQAAALALDIGLPTEAANAIEAAELWDDSAAPAVIAAIAGTSNRLPASWSESWQARPEIASALAADTTDEAADAAAAELAEELSLALVAAGLADPETTLSPAQRRERGLIRRRPVRRALTRVLAAAAIVVLGGLGALLALNLSGVLEETPETAPGTVTVVVTAPTTPTTIALEDTELERPGTPLGGEWPTEGGSNERRGDANQYVGLAEPQGIYWKAQKSGQFEASPVAIGQMVIIGNHDRRLYFFDKRGGEVQAPGTEDAIAATATANRLELGGGAGTTAISFVGSGDSLYAFDVQTGGERWTRPIEVPGSAVLVEATVYVGSADGHVYGLDAFTGDTTAQWPAADQDPPAGAITTSVSFAEGRLFYGRRNIVYMLDLATGDEVECGDTQPFQRVSTPVVAGGTVYVASVEGALFFYDAATCRSDPLAPQYIFGAGSSLEDPPAVVDGVIYQPITQGIAALLARPVDGLIQPVWGTPDPNCAIEPCPILPNPAPMPSPPSSSPVIANGVLYVGSDDGHVYAIRLGEEPETVWTFRVGSEPVSTPAVFDGVVYAASLDGTIVAIAGVPGTAPEEGEPEG